MEVTYRRPDLYPAQMDAIFHPARYSIIEASTKAGKTVGCLAWILEQALVHGKPGRNYWWIAPVYRQAKIAFTRLRRNLTPGISKPNESDLYIDLANEARVWFISGEKPDNLYGEDVYAAVIDEASRVREESWHAVRSTLTATKGPARIVGNVKGTGNWMYEMARRAERGDDESLHYARLTWKDAVDAGVLEQSEIDDARAMLPEPVFRELYEAEAAELIGRVYYGFSANENVDDVSDVGGELYVGMDFNVDPMTAVLAVKAGDGLHVLDEIEIRNSGTEEMACEIAARVQTAEWLQQRDNRSIIVCPDPSGSARKTSAGGKTDFSILGSHGFEVRADRKAPDVSDRVNEVNAMLRAADGRRRMLIHPRCRNLLRALEYHTYKKGTSQPEKGKGFDHLNDALGYLVHSEFPIITDDISSVRRPW